MKRRAFHSENFFPRTAILWSHFMSSQSLTICNILIMFTSYLFLLHSYYTPHLVIFYHEWLLGIIYRWTIVKKKGNHIIHYIERMYWHWYTRLVDEEESDSLSSWVNYFPITNSFRQFLLVLLKKKRKSLKQWCLFHNIYQNIYSKK